MTLTEAKPRLITAADSRVVDERDRMKQWLAQRVALGATKPITEIVTLTPTLAQLLLESNPGNRPVSPTNLERIKRDIGEGLFEFNGESIIVSRDGKLNNGQHRCIGVVESGLPIRVVMVFGVERETRMTLDQGVTRTVGHFIGMKGFKNSNVVGSAAGFAWQHAKGYPIANAGKSWGKATKSEVLLFINDHPDIVESVEFVMSKPSVALGASKSLLAFCHFAIAHRLPKRDSHAADLFIDTLMSGDGLRKRDAILYVRNRLLDLRKLSAGNANYRAQLIFMAWNHYRRNEKIDRLWVDAARPLPPLDA